MIASTPTSSERAHAIDMVRMLFSEYHSLSRREFKIPVTRAMDEPLYFAYGSNLNHEDRKSWLSTRGFDPDCMEPVATAWLPDHDVRFSLWSSARQGGVLDIVPRSGQAVAGMLFRMTDIGWAAMHEKEGVREGHYEPHPVTVLDPDGNEVRCLTYRVREEAVQPFVNPNPTYARIVVAGLKSCGMPTEAVEAAATGQTPPWLIRDLFVYGTLMDGECRSPYLTRFRLPEKERGHVAGRLILLDDYPGLIRVDGVPARVRGEIIRLKEVGPALQVLDVVEGFAGFGKPDPLFRRTIWSVKRNDGQSPSWAWGYAWAGSETAGPAISSGNWHDR